MKLEKKDQNEVTTKIPEICLPDIMGTFLISSIKSNQINKTILNKLDEKSGGEILPEGAEIIISLTKGYDTRLKTLKIEQKDVNAIQTISIQYQDIYGNTILIKNKSIEYLTNTYSLNDGIPTEVISKITIKILKLKNGSNKVKFTVSICGCYQTGKKNGLIKKWIELLN